MIPRTFLSLVLVLTNVSLTLAQQPTVSPPKSPAPGTQTPASQTQKPADVDAQDVVRITTNLVQVDAVVTRDGKYVTDLTAEDFEIYSLVRRSTFRARPTSISRGFQLWAVYNWEQNLRPAPTFCKSSLPIKPRKRSIKSFRNGLISKSSSNGIDKS